jgi:signal transduction histidine kinase
VWGHDHIGGGSDVENRTVLLYSDQEVVATVAGVSEAAGIEFGVLPRFRQRVWQFVLVDLLPAVWISLLTVNATLNIALGHSSGTVVAIWSVGLVVGALLVVRRWRPNLVFGVVVTTTIVTILLGMSVEASALAVAVAVYPVALLVGTRRSAISLGAALLGVTLATVLVATVPHFHFLLVTPNPKYTNLFSSLTNAWLAISAGWAFGRNVRARREYANQIVEHRAQQAVSEERLRIAREMHDVVAHSIGVIVMKAAVANHVYDTRPEEGREALDIIESVGRAALTDIQRVLGSLRSAEEADLAPSPDLDELPKLIENARLADVQVEFDRGIIPALPAAVQLSAYRIVQEALTNVIKHVATPARCTISITAESGELRLAVIDDGRPGRPVSAPGHGLIGMRERAALHNGTLIAGWQPNGGFAVHARLPYQA